MKRLSFVAVLLRIVVQTKNVVFTIAVPIPSRRFILKIKQFRTIGCIAATKLHHGIRNLLQPRGESGHGSLRLLYLLLAVVAAAAQHTTIASGTSIPCNMIGARSIAHVPRSIAHHPTAPFCFFVQRSQPLSGGDRIKLTAAQRTIASTLFIANDIQPFNARTNAFLLVLLILLPLLKHLHRVAAIHIAIDLHTLWRTARRRRRRR
mmetsp:Transcript_42083/g.69347  ORF Transcript_42083/g.69347 Transcript_42083/m.69347 type:complete len:206 (+) Transcript_42083:388-1005(+)